MSGSPEIEEALTIAERVAARLAATAAARDRKGGIAHKEREIIRESGLLLASIPREHGGWGLGWRELLALHRIVLAADSALGHLLGFHAFALASATFVGTREQATKIYRETVANRWFWGNAHNSPTVVPTDPGQLAPPKVTIAARNDHYVLSGTNPYCSGSGGADMLIFSAVHKGAMRLRSGLVTGIVPARRDGVVHHDDWDAFGQRQTESGSVSFETVRIEPDELFLEPGPFHDAFSTQRTGLVHLFLANTYLGTAEGALQSAIAITRERSMPFAGSGVAQIADDPFVLRRFGLLTVELAAARALVNQAATTFQNAWDAGHDLDTALRGRTDIEIYTAKVAAAQSGLKVAGEIFELTGARSTRSELALDRFWRNLRVHTLHDPIDLRLRDIGRWALTGKAPPIAPPA